MSALRQRCRLGEPLGLLALRTRCAPASVLADQFACQYTHPEAAAEFKPPLHARQDNCHEDREETLRQTMIQFAFDGCERSRADQPAPETRPAASGATQNGSIHGGSPDVAMANGSLRTR